MDGTVAANEERRRIEESTLRQGRALLAELRRQERRMGPGWLYDRLSRLVLNDETLKVQLFRFVDVLPALKTPQAVTQHLLEFLDQPGVRLPAGTRRLLALLGRTTPTEWLLGDAARLGTGLMAQHLIAGEDARQAVGAIERLRRQHLAFSLDLLGEAVISEAEARAYQQKYLQLIGDLCALSRRWPPDPQTDEAPFGELPRVNVSLKLTSLYSRFDPMAAGATAAAVKERLRPLLSRARECGAFVNFDMEQYDYRDLTQRIFEEILLEDEFRDWPHAGVVVQAYLRDSEDDLERLLNWAGQRGTPVWVRLVKGAYWDYENVMAAQRNYPLPVFEHKSATDANYERLTGLLLTNWRTLRPAIATHNVRSAAHAMAVADELGLPPRAVEYQVLFGMGDPLARTLAERGERVRVYVPFGELLPGMAYLVRRLLENTSNDSFLRRSDEAGMMPEELLAPPVPSTPPSPSSQRSSSAFRNEPLTDFARGQNRDQMRAALEEVRQKFGEAVPVVIAGRREEAPAVRDLANPSDAQTIVARIAMASPEQAQRAIEAADRAFPAWRDTPATERAALLRRVAAEFRRRRFEISAWQVFEVGKPWREADADVAEAIDFCEYYAREMERLAHPRRRNVPGEWNDYLHEARGPAAIIAPWNFPLAILTGMTVAALVTGNSVVIKPAEQSSRTGYFLLEALEAAGVPAGVANFVPGEGETIGPLLVADPRITLVAFTGSRAVGLSIIATAAQTQPGQREIKRVIAEMGGKNAIIIDEDADLDQAVRGVLYSAVGYSGQKCSACSRVIAIGAAYKPFCARFAEAVKSLQIGPAEDPATTLGPVVDRDAQERIINAIETGRREGRLLAEIQPPPGSLKSGYFVPAAVFTDYPPEGTLSQQEIFGPVVIVYHARELDEALRLAADSPYALTGGFYSRSPEHIERVRREFRVGNLYINRGITGALVDRQPFGGRKMSGLGTKAGGPDYLLQFLTPRAITESVLQHGFAPPLRVYDETE